MVDTCDPTVCAWSDDGETFFVKNPSKFEKEIIPQFFKHNKFSSFVRQLNFYSFRKIKTNDSIRIDPELEKATANFWRFFHPKFQRGRPDLLKDIKTSYLKPYLEKIKLCYDKFNFNEIIENNKILNKIHNFEYDLNNFSPVEHIIFKIYVNNEDIDDFKLPRRCI